MTQYVEFRKTENGNLEIRLTPEGRAELAELPEEELQHDHDIFEVQLCNGWERIAPEECGALTDALIITDDCERDEHGKLTRLGRVYSNIGYYQVESDAQRLMRHEVIFWPGVDSEKK